MYSYVRNRVIRYVQVLYGVPTLNRVITFLKVSYFYIELFYFTVKYFSCGKTFHCEVNSIRPEF